MAKMERVNVEFHLDLTALRKEAVDLIASIDALEKKRKPKKKKEAKCRK